MLPGAAALLRCPVCATRLELGARALRCESGHAFDLARQGYVNLLGRAQPANADTPAMLAARARVHASGLFEPLTQAVAGFASGSRLLEVGAGTGHYLASALGTDAAAVGVALDVSVAAAKACAQADPRIGAVVADVWRPLPVAGTSMDAVLCVFAPRNLAEFARVLRPGGRLVVATPNPPHLAGLRDRYGLLGVPEAKAATLAADSAGHFRLLESVAVRHTVAVTASLAADLVAMGPNAFHRLPEAVGAQDVAVDVTVQVFSPCPEAGETAKMSG